MVAEPATGDPAEVSAAATPVDSPTPPPPRERQVLVLDLSRSMLAPLPDPSGTERQKIEIARSAVLRIVQHAESASTQFGLVTFSDTPRVAVPLGDIRRENLPYVESLIAMLNPSGRSAIWDALALGADLLKDANGVVTGALVLVTDGWDNASSRFEPPGTESAAGGRVRKDLFAHLLAPGSALHLRVIGIGNGAQRDKGVDSERMNLFLNGLSARALLVGVPTTFLYEEVDTGTDLYTQMVHAFVDVDDVARPPPSQMHPDDLAQHASQAAKALKDPQQHSAIGRLARPSAPPGEADMPYSEAPVLDVGVLAAGSGTSAASLKERYGPLANVVEAYVARDFARASAELGRAHLVLPPVTYAYWEAKIAYGRGEIVEAARSLLVAWNASETLPLANRIRVTRRLALLQAQMQNDPETETLLRFIDETESRSIPEPPDLKERLMDLFERLLELRGTYQLTRIGAADDASGAQRHEEAVEEIFDLLQDVRLDNSAGDATVDGALDFIEICLAEMR
ncbi:MAG TPA: vWA domain-containing protein [Thermoplasmata archaeon]|nr:vWA domain-containing protein [Thermoplasmata archaeon]